MRSHVEGPEIGAEHLLIGLPSLMQTQKVVRSPGEHCTSSLEPSHVPLQLQLPSLPMPQS